MEVEKNFIAKENKDKFLIGFQGLNNSWSERVIFTHAVGYEELINFTNTLEVPEKWLKILKEIDGGIELLNRHKQNSGQVEQCEKKIVKIELIFRGNKKVVPKCKNSIVLDNIKRITGIKTDAQIAEIIGKHFTAVSAIRREKGLFHLEHLEMIAEKFNLSVNDLLTVEMDVKCNALVNLEKNVRQITPELDNICLIEEINKVVQSACFFTGSLADSTLELDNKKFFSGYLIEDLTDYSLQFSVDGNEITFRKENFVYTLNIEHLPFRQEE